MATSTVPVAKAALLTALQARAGLNGVKVIRGKVEDVPDTEAIAIGPVIGAQRPMTLGGGRRRETYSLSVTIEVRQDKDQASATDRTYALLAEVENALRADKKLGGAVDVAQLESWSDVEETSDTGHSCAITALIACDAQLP